MRARGKLASHRGSFFDAGLARAADRYPGCGRSEDRFLIGINVAGAP
jgi:hypothetical protein